MERVNGFYKIKAKDSYASAEWQSALSTFAQLLAPFAPHISEELWSQLGNTGSVHLASWPVHDEKYLVSDIMTIVVQVNGKVRAQVHLPIDSTEEQVLTTAKAEPHVQEYISGGTKREIYIPGKLVNLVV